VQPHGILESVLYARDLAAGRRFYVEVLGLDVLTEQAGRHVFFRCGRGMFLLFNPDSTAKEATHVNGALVPLHGTTGAGHLAFAIRESELEAWRHRLKMAGVPIESEVAWPKGGRSIYFRDPAGNSVELATPRLWGLEEELFAP